MYIDKDSNDKFSLINMDTQEAASLGKMIEGAGLEERRVFFPALNQLRKEIRKMNCRDCLVKRFPPCNKEMPCCQCAEKECNSRQECPGKE